LKYEVLNLPYVPGTALHYASPLARRLRHPAFGWLGLRPVLAQHTAAEHAAIARWATGRNHIVEIGVAEGVSALAMREVMAENGLLWLIDPFHISRVPALNFLKLAAHRAVASCPRGGVRWIEQFSFDAAKSWDSQIDLLMIDGDHSHAGVRRDWDDWSQFIVPGGVAIFHDARAFEGGWTGPSYGPVKLVNELFRERKIPSWKIAEEIHSLVVVERQG
jgi:predicted O-methyltransferase YrrM